MIHKPLKTIEKLTGGEALSIAALGDSLTQGWMCRKGYVDFFSEMLEDKFKNNKIKMINSGIPGNTAGDGRARLRTDVLDYNPDLVLIQFGLNDLYCGYSGNEFRRNIKSIVDSVRDNSFAEMIILTSNLLLYENENTNAEKFYSLLAEVGESEKIPVALTHEYWREKINQGMPLTELLQSDGVHPTVEGYRLMAESLMLLF